MIKLDKINIIFNRSTVLEKQALKDISLEIETGSFVTLIGSNGSGKSTLLAALAGDVLSASGSIFFGTNEVSRQSTSQRAGQVARVFQDPLVGSCGDLSIEENLSLSFRRGLRRGLRPALNRHRRELFRENLAILGLGLENRMSDLMSSLSGGQRQAVCLIMAVLAKSSILLLDEHTAALDPGMADFIMQLTQKLVQENQLTTLMVTHSMRQALDYGHRTIMLDHGEIILDVQGQERAELTVDGLIKKFSQLRGTPLDDDALLMG